VEAALSIGSRVIGWDGLTGTIVALECGYAFVQLDRPYLMPGRFGPMEHRQLAYRPSDLRVTQDGAQLRLGR
jgi:hypothetical protein